jgi:demethylmenaquinone methyltransferase/2-methoxy-6-polyprenyl-1,4-benzoquinol methylase
MALNVLPEAAHKSAAVRSMFDRIAPRYDRMNRLLTAGLDQRWRRAALEAIGVGAEDRVVDLACGTGDLAELARRRGARVLGVDYAPRMLLGARLRGIDAAWVQADGAALPLPDGCVSAVTCGFALRNFTSLVDVLGEVARVLEPGGRVALIEVDRPSSALLRAGHSLYFERLVPLLGGWLSDRDAYRYLPQSVAYLPPPPELLRLLERVGFVDVARRSLSLGAVQILTGVRGAAS